MFRYSVGRTIAILPIVWVVTAVVFGLTYLSPGDPAAILAGDYATPEQIAAIRDRLQLDAPILKQYVTWLTKVVSGDLGVSIFSGQPVLSLILSRIEPTISLAIAAMIIALIIAVPLGLIAARYKGTQIDNIINLFCVAGTSVPAFFVGYILIFTFGVYYGSMPIQGFVGIEAGPIELLRHVLLPAIMLGMAQTALITRTTRASAIEVLSQDFVRVARAKGVDEVTIMVRHCLRLIGVPLATIIGASFAALLGGVVITETVFAIPGVGRLIVDAIQQKDIPVIQGVLLMSSFIYILINLIVDLSYLIIDPRIKYS